MRVNRISARKRTSVRDRQIADPRSMHTTPSKKHVEPYLGRGYIALTTCCKTVAIRTTMQRRSPMPPRHTRLTPPPFSLDAPFWSACCRETRASLQFRKAPN